MEEYKRLADALRFCAEGASPCYSCPLYAEDSITDCQNTVMLRAAEAIEQLTTDSN